ncbi:MAG: hypothetical protein A3H44_10510 [Gammaproteobacteria bacterium RIFCSPLOWO2_02_FULL_57_10]|nr:MAG: hypothetical protein A3H44_10510 [Gammaproteobacteria bacterium RIFCSPLOWO2_02_FULL_57_10]
MKLIEPPKNKFEFLWPDVSTEYGRRFARNEGIFALICFFGQYMVRLDEVYLQIEAGATGLDFNKNVYLITLAILVFFAWRVYKFGIISSVFGLLIAIGEFTTLSMNYPSETALPIWNATMILLATQGVRASIAHRRTNRNANAA